MNGYFTDNMMKTDLHTWLIPDESTVLVPISNGYDWSGPMDDKSHIVINYY